MDPRVETALTDLARARPEAGVVARQAWDALTGGSGDAGEVSQWWLQMFCWDLLARDEDLTPQQRWQAARAVGDLLERIGLHRYAGIARGEATRDVLLGSDDPQGYPAAYAAALRGSAIQPPDTELLTWGSVMGPTEADTYERVAHALELSTVVGDLVAAGRGSRRVRATVTDAVLTSPHRALRGARPLHGISSERLNRWTARSPALAALLAPLADELTAGVPVPVGVASDAMLPLEALLRCVAEPVRLTASGYLPPAVVDALARAVGARAATGRSRREVDVPEVRLLREAAQRLGLVRARGRSLVLTARGRSAVTGPDGLAVAVAAGWFPRTRSATVVAREVVTALLAGGRAPSGADVAATVQQVLSEEGWRVQDGPVPVGVARSLAWHARRDVLNLGMAPGVEGDDVWRVHDHASPVLTAALRHHLLHHGPSQAQ